MSKRRRAVVLSAVVMGSWAAASGCSQRVDTPTHAAAEARADGAAVEDAERAGPARTKARAEDRPRAEEVPSTTAPVEAAERVEAVEAVEAVKPVIATIVLGSFPEDLLDAVEAAVRESLPVEVRRGATWELPPAAYYRPRRRYRADTLIDLLSDAAHEDPEEGVRYLGLASVDISTTKGKHRDWGVFGLAFCPGRGAVISEHRLKKGARDREHFAFRVANTAVHEVGHSLGLEHCDEPRCPMRDAEGSIATTDSSDRALGPECAAKLAAILAK